MSFYGCVVPQTPILIKVSGYRLQSFLKFISIRLESYIYQLDRNQKYLKNYQYCLERLIQIAKNLPMFFCMFYIPFLVHLI